MREKALYEYSVIRVLPRVDREEFINVGVLLYCQSQNFLRSSSALNEARIKAFAADVRPEAIREHLLAIEAIATGGEAAGPIGLLPIGERFRWLTAPRSTVLQFSPVHTGLTVDAAGTLAALVNKLVH